MGNYGNLPLTGGGALILGGTALTTPWVALAGAALVIVGFLLLRLTRPARTHRR